MIYVPWSFRAGGLGPAARVAGAWVVLATAPAFASPERQAVDDLAVRVDEVASVAKSYEQVAGPSGGALSDAEATERFAQATYLHLVNKHDMAAEIFFVLLTSRSLEGMPIQRDAEWYLAESLLGAGNEDIAIARYQAIMRTAGHPFRDEAVRRLLEIYADDSDTQRFEALYEAEILGRGVAPSDLILYTIGKATWRRGEPGRAKTYLDQVAPESPYHARARYLVGAIAVDAGDELSMDLAKAEFHALAAITPASEADRAVRDLAQLAIARIHLDRGDLEAALAAYRAVPEDSPYAPETLHELTWVFIRLDSFAQARETADAFLSRFPDHAYTTELNLIRGHLLFEVGAYDDALVAYDKVVQAYTPVQRRFDRLSKSEDSAERYVHQVMALERGGDSGVEGETEPLPGYAVALMKEDGGLERAVSLFRELERQDASLSSAELLIRQIGTALGSSADSTGSLQGLRFSVSESGLRALGLWVELLGMELDWLGDNGVGVVDFDARRMELGRRVAAITDGLDVVRYDLGSARASLRASGRDEAEVTATLEAAKASLAALSPSASAEDRAAVEAAVAQAELALATLGSRAAQARADLDVAAARLSGDTAPIEAEVTAFAREVRALRGAATSDLTMDPLSARFDRLGASLDQAVTRLRRTDAALAGGEGGQLLRVRDVWLRETAAVAKERGELGERYADAEVVAGGLVRDNFARLAARFGEAVLGADMGAVNVYWSSLLELGDRIDQLADDRGTLLRDLSRKYAYLEQKVKP